MNSGMDSILDQNINLENKKAINPIGDVFNQKEIEPENLKTEIITKFKMYDRGTIDLTKGMLSLSLF